MRHITLIFLFLSLLSCGEGTPPVSKTADQPKAPTPTLPVKESIDPALAGSWVLAGLPQSTIAFDKLFPRQRPMINIQPNMRLISGSTGCNRFSATMSTLGDKLSFMDFTSSTLTCVGAAESNFLSAWSNAKQYRFRNTGELIWGSDSVVWLVFRRR